MHGLANKLTLKCKQNSDANTMHEEYFNPKGWSQITQWSNAKRTNANFLGVTVDQHLNYNDHISMVSQKKSKSLA